MSVCGYVLRRLVITYQSLHAGGQEVYSFAVMSLQISRQVSSESSYLGNLIPTYSSVLCFGSGCLYWLLFTTITNCQYVSICLLQPFISPLFVSIRTSYHLCCPFFVDIYVCCVSYTHAVAAKNFFLALVATNVETADPVAELRPGLDLLGPVLEKYDFYSLFIINYKKE